jgi:hypothetical protein
MKWLNTNVLENRIAQDRNFFFTIISFLVILVAFVNLNTVESLPVGFVAFSVYFAINSVFLGNVFFKKENVFLRSMLGVLLLITLLGLIGWLAILVYNLDVASFSLVLAIAAAFSSLMNRRMKTDASS